VFQRCNVCSPCLHPEHKYHRPSTDHNTALLQDYVAHSPHWWLSLRWYLLSRSDSYD